MARERKKSAAALRAAEDAAEDSDFECEPQEVDDGSDFETNAGQAEAADDEDEDMDDVVEEEKDDDEDEPPAKKVKKEKAPKVPKKAPKAAKEKKPKGAKAEKKPTVRGSGATKGTKGGGTVGAAKAKPKTLGAGDTKNLVKDLLERSNRPFNAQICFDMLQSKGAGKTAVTKALEAMAESGDIKCRVMGKAKIYIAVQPDDVMGEEEAKTLRAEVEELIKSASEKEAEAKAAGRAFTALAAEPTDEQLASDIGETTARVGALEEKLVSLRATGTKIDPAEMALATTNTSKAAAEWRKRMRMYKDLEGALLENLAEAGYTTKKFREEVECETDEAAGVDAKAVEKMLKEQEKKNKAAAKAATAPAEGGAGQTKLSGA